MVRGSPRDHGRARRPASSHGMIIDARAHEELRAAAGWYEDQRDGLGDEFLAVIDEVLARIEEAPGSFPRDRFDERARRAHVDRFPYAIVFIVQPGEVWVIGSRAAAAERRHACRAAYPYFRAQARPRLVRGSR